MIIYSDTYGKASKVILLRCEKTVKFYEISNFFIIVLVCTIIIYNYVYFTIFLLSHMISVMLYLFLNFVIIGFFV